MATLLSNSLTSDEIPEESTTALRAIWDAAKLISLVDSNADMCYYLLENFLLISQEQVAAITTATAECETDIVTS